MKRILLTLSLTLAATGLTFAVDKNPLFKVGGGIDYLALNVNQEFAKTFGNALGFWGIHAFADVTDYFTVSAGYLRGLGSDDLYADKNPFPAESNPNTLNEVIFEAAVKYPFSFGPAFTLAPKLGASDQIFLSGEYGTGSITLKEEKQYLSPLSVFIGADADWSLDNTWLLRIPVVLGVGLNSKFDNAFYEQGGGSYKSSSALTFRLGVSVGYRL